MTNSAVAAALRFLKEAAANLADASTAIAGTDREAPRKSIGSCKAFQTRSSALNPCCLERIKLPLRRPRIATTVCNDTGIRV